MSSAFRIVVGTAWRSYGLSHGRSIQPGLANVPLSEITAGTGLSITTASGARTGKRVPHPRHWNALAHVLTNSARE